MFASSKGRVKRVNARHYINYLKSQTSVDKTIKKGGEGYFGFSSQSKWLGSGLASVGLDKENKELNIQTSHLMNLIWGYAPDKVPVQQKDGKTRFIRQPLVKSAGKTDGLGFVDISLSVPKSVSLLWATANDDLRKRLEQIQDEVTAEFLAQLEQTSCMRRRVGDEVFYERPKGLIATSFRHTTSRPVGGMLDPQLHDHVVIAGIAPRREEHYTDDKYGKFGTIEPAVLLQMQGEKAGIVSTIWIKRLRELGYDVVKTKTAWEIKGVSQEMITSASKRSVEIDAEIARREAHGQVLTQSEKKQITIDTRKSKETAKVTDTEALFAQWRAEYGAGMPEPRPNKVAQLDPSTFKTRRQQVYQQALEALSDKKSSWKLGDLRLQIAIEAELLLTYDEVSHVLMKIEGTPLDELPQLIQGVRIRNHAPLHLTSQIVVDRENKVINKLSSLTSYTPKVNIDSLIQGATKGLNVELSIDQRQAVITALTNLVSLIEAPAGTGKGTVAKVVSAIEQSQGHRVYAVAMAGTRAEAFGKEIGATTSYTTEAFENAVKKGYLKLADGDTILIDEVSQLETNRWLKIINNLGEAKVRIGLFGDRKQLDSIGAGGLLKEIADQLPPQAIVTLEKQWRNPTDGVVWDLLREGKIKEAVAIYDGRGDIKITKNKDTAIAKLMKDWNLDRIKYPEKSQLIVTDRSNYDIDKINANASLSANNNQPSVNYTYKDPDKQYVRTETLRLNDPVVATRYMNKLNSNHSANIRYNIKNGTTGIISEINKDHIVVRWNNGKTTIMPPDRYNGLRLAYCRHVSGAQGATVDRVYDLIGGWQTDKASAYVAISRSKETSHIYIDKEGLGITDEDDYTDEEIQARLVKSISVDHSQVAGITGLKELEPSPPHIEEKEQTERLRRLEKQREMKIRWNLPPPPVFGQELKLSG